MSRFLFNENVPTIAVEAARLAGFDVVSISEICPGADDRAVLARSVAEDRVLVTFDKDFGELGFREGARATAGIILLRPRLTSPDYIAGFVLDVLGQTIEWNGHFSVARESQVRVVPLEN